MNLTRVCLLGSLVAAPTWAGHAQGHGPAFGLSTPTLAKGAWSLDLPLMSRFVGDTRTLMFRPLLSRRAKDLRCRGCGWPENR